MKNAIKVDNFLAEEPWVRNINTKNRYLCLVTHTIVLFVANHNHGVHEQMIEIPAAAPTLQASNKHKCYSNNAQPVFVIMLTTATEDEQVETWNVINCIIQPISCWKETKKFVTKGI